MSPEILLVHSHPLGACYLARQDGLFLAGRTPASARAFPTAQAAYDVFRPYADEGHHWAWNLCYHLEDHLHP